jgi:splicing factor 3A subunit 3
MNIPLGPDGKPIPYWLYKMKGLNVIFSCEICGGATYRGHREFDRHFFELKHSIGMKSLGIPNTKAFHGVIKIKDAQLLFEKVKKTGGDGVRATNITTATTSSSIVDDGGVEEFQDSAGNVVDKKTYADLARCGLL